MATKNQGKTKKKQQTNRKSFVSLVCFLLVFLRFSWPAFARRAEVVNRSPDDLSIRRAITQVVEAVAHLHGLGIVHADIKPGNVLVDAHGLARLADFDISVDSDTRTSTAH